VRYGKVQEVRPITPGLLWLAGQTYFDVNHEKQNQKSTGIHARSAMTAISVEGFTTQILSVLHHASLYGINSDLL
jgi:hypothetical protein